MIMDRIIDLLVTILNVANFVRLYGEEQTRRLLRFELQLSIFMISLFTFGMIMGWEWLAVSSAFFTSILGLLIWKQTEIVLNILSGLAGIKLEEPDNRYLKVITKPIRIPTELAQNVLRPAVEDIRSILMPLLTTSLAISFLASYISIKGLDYFNLKDLMIYSTVILFLAIYFWAYLSIKEKWAGKAMFIWLLWLIAAHYLWPVQIQGMVEVMGNKITSRVTKLVSGSQNGKIINISVNTPLYQFDHGNIELLKDKGGKPKRIKKDIKAKLIGRKKAPNSDETLYKVILPVEKDLYVGGEEVYVPARSVKITEEPPSRDTALMTWLVKKEPQKLLTVYNGDEFEYLSPKGFWIIHGNGQRFYHNPSTHQNDLRSFFFSEMPPEGRTISIVGEDEFQINFRVVKKKG